MVAEYLACFSSPVQTVIIGIGAATCASSLLASVFVAAGSESTAPQSEDDYYEAKPAMDRKLVYSKSSPTGSCIHWNGTDSKKLLKSPKPHGNIATKVLLSAPRLAQMEGGLSGRTFSASPRLLTKVESGGSGIPELQSISP